MNSEYVLVDCSSSWVQHNRKLWLLLAPNGVWAAEHGFYPQSRESGAERSQ